MAFIGTDKIENLWFKIGFSTTVVVFVAMNFATYVRGSMELAERRQQGIRLSNEGVAWGFPLKMYIPFYGIEATPVAINFILALLAAAVIGIALESIAGKVRIGRDINVSE